MSGKWQQRIKGLAQNLTFKSSCELCSRQAISSWREIPEGQWQLRALGKAYAGVAPAHIFHYAGTDSLRIGSYQTKVARYGNDIDMAIFPVFAACEPTELAKPQLGNATLVNARPAWAAG
jgi:hypothetical protein